MIDRPTRETEPIDELTRLRQRIAELEILETQRRLAQEALRASEENYRLVVENSPQAILVAQDGLLRFANASAVRISGHSLDYLCARPFLEFIHPDDRGSLSEFYEKGLKGEEVPARQEVRVLDKDGRVIWAEIRAVRMQWQGRPATLNFMTDITKRKLVELALRRSEQEKALILDSVSERIEYQNLEYEIMWANRAAGLGAGLPPEEMIGRRCYEVWRRRSEPCPGCVFKKAVEAGQPVEEQINMAHGGVGIERITPIRDQSGRLIGAVKVITDITARKLAEEALARSEEQHRLLLEIAPMAILAHGDGRIEYANPAAVKLFRAGGAEELLGRPYLDLVHPDDRAESERRMSKAVGEGWFAPLRRHRFVRLDGQVIEVESIGTAFEHEGKILIQTVVQDISERKRAEEEKAQLEIQLMQAQKMQAIGTLAGGIAHDFNNILAAMTGYTELAMADLAEEDPARQSLDQVLQAGLRAKNLIRQILSFSRQAKPEKKPVQLSAVVRESLKLLRASLPATIEIRQATGEGSGLVLGDLTQIYQLIMNLGTNAAQAMSQKGGLLEIRVERVDLDEEAAGRFADLRPGVYQRLEVSDTGVGMDQATLGRIFEPFFTTKGPGVGTGMGLAVVHGIIKGHGGAITVSSQPGRGSTFEIYLPSMEEQLPITEIAEDGPLPMGRESVLFVDDEAALADIGRQVLERLGYRVTTRTSSLEALGLFKAQPDRFDLVVTDQTMPHLTGVELAREMLKMRPDLPIILCTGFSEQISAEKARAMGIRRFVMKPLVIREVAAVIRSALDEKD